MTSACRWILLAAACLLGAQALVGCSVERHYRTLSFFFDGVPDPNAPPPELPPSPEGPTIAEIARMSNVERAALLSRQVRAQQVTYHEPWREDRCRDCHAVEQTRGQALFGAGIPDLVAPLQELCFRCHEQPQGAFVHGPSATGDCWTCHLPHQSPHAWLLREGDEATLCGGCHVPELFVTAAEHASYAGTSCSQCHDPHAADRQGLLRPQAPLPEDARPEDDEGR